MRLCAFALSMAASSLALGCSKGGGAEGSGAAATAAPGAAATAAPGGATTAAAVTTGGAAPVAPALPKGRSPMPTLAEWGSMREVTVKGSSALGCETKMVREYLRVSCRGKNDSGGTPTAVRVVKGGRGEALTFASGGVTSLVIPFIEGLEAEVMFSWTDKSHPLKMVWPRGAPKPTVIGVFEGAKSPLDGTAGGNEAKLCECHKKINGSKTCDDMIGGPNPDCDRTYGGDCQRLLECSRGEPASMPRCLPGFKNAFTGHVCAKACDGGKACPAGFECTDIGNGMGCTEK